MRIGNIIIDTTPRGRAGYDPLRVADLTILENHAMKYSITAEHTNGKSVGHPCSDGVYSDPTDGFEILVDATDEDAARRVGWAELLALAEAAEPCRCQRHKQPGSDAWVRSVTLTVSSRHGIDD